MVTDEARTKVRDAIERVETLRFGRRSNATRTLSPYGKKGGTSTNAGRKATTYEVTLPDKTTARLRSYHVSSQFAFVRAYPHEGKWYTSNVHATEGGVPKYKDGAVTLEARRVSK